MELRAREDNSVVGVRAPTSKKGLEALRSRGHLEMTIEEEETLQEMEEVVAKVEELPIIAINAISWGIDHSSVQIMKKINTEENI